MEIHSPETTRLDGVLAAARHLEHELGAFVDERSPRSDETALAEQVEATYEAGNLEAALELIDGGVREPVSPSVRARLQHVKGKIEWLRGTPLVAHELLVTEAELVASVDAAQASVMLADAAHAAMFDDPPRARATAERARELAAEPAAAARADLALAAILLDEGAVDERIIRSALDRLHEAPEDPSGAAAGTVVVALFWLEDYNATLQILEILIERARRSGDPRLAQWLDTSAAALGATGRWNAAEARSREALRIAREHGQQGMVASCLTTQSWLAARRGRERECRRLVAEALAVEERSDLVSVWAASALGLLDLGLGDLEGAIATLEGVVDSPAPRIGGDPSWTYAYAHLIEAYIGVGRKTDAVEALRELEELGRHSPRPLVAATTARCRGLVAPADEFEHHFESALAHHRRGVNVFPRAHTELAYGLRLRRARRRVDARTHLRAALATFEQLGATPWAARARRELAATRSRSTPTSTDITELLTPQELAVATLVARGLRNNDVAARLYVTRRAVEYHLTNIYRKLEIGSRTQLTGLLSQQ